MDGIRKRANYAHSFQAILRVRCIVCGSWDNPTHPITPVPVDDAIVGRFHQVIELVDMNPQSPLARDQARIVGIGQPGQPVEGDAAMWRMFLDEVEQFGLFALQPDAMPHKHRLTAGVTYLCHRTPRKFIKSLYGSRRGAIEWQHSFL